MYINLSKPTHTSSTSGIKKPLLLDLDAEKDGKAQQNEQQAKEHRKLDQYSKIVKFPCNLLEKIKKKM